MPKLEEGWITVALLAAMLTVASWGVAAASWADGLWAGWPSALLGLAAGLALAKSQFRGWQASLFAIVYGLFVVGFFICLTLPGDWHQRSLTLVIRLNNFLYKLIHGGTNRDALPFPVVIGLIFWALSVLAAWSVFRRGQVWPAVIPVGLALLLNVYYYLGPVQLDLYLAVYVLLALLLVARMSLLVREREWVAARIAYSPELRFDFLRAGLVAALVGVTVGWAGPSLAASPAAASAWRQVSGPLAVVRESWMRLFASIKARGQNVNDFYGDSLTLGGPAILDDDPIMDIAVVVNDDVPDAAINVGLAPIARYYWRSVTHDTYSNGRWSNEGSAFKEFDPLKQGNLRLPAYQQRRDVRLQFTSYVGASSRLYIAPQPRWIDRPVTLGMVLTPGEAADVSTVLARDIVRRGETYNMIASITVADEESLRGAGTAYPQWVTDHYLQLPDDISERTLALAQQIVDDADARTPYDRAVAITNWLRDNIRYDQQIDAPPSEVEPVDWTLFVTRSGYCTYYASAEIVLLRALGIPARFAAGFNQGQYDTSTGVYHVVERNAHAWPEVFFPGFGWIEFEPTASEPPIVRPERRQTPEDTDATAPDRDPGPTPAPLDERDVPDPLEGSVRPPTYILWLNNASEIARQLLLIAIGLSAGLTAAALILVRLGVIGWENLGRLGRWVLHTRGQMLPSAITLAYLNLERAARWMGLKLAEALTPHERAQAVSQAVPVARDGIETITAEYVAERYSPRPDDAHPAVARQAWAGIRWPVWKETLRGFIRTWTEDELSKASRARRARVNKN